MMVAVCLRPTAATAALHDCFHPGRSRGGLLLTCYYQGFPHCLQDWRTVFAGTCRLLKPSKVKPVFNLPVAQPLNRRARHNDVPVSIAVSTSASQQEAPRSGCLLS